MDLKKIQLKLQKLLALSASDNEAEAELAIAKCQELMEKYGIRTIDVNEETNETDISTMSVPGFTKRHVAWESKLGTVIAECFDGIVVIQRRQDGWNLMFIASKSEMPIIIDLYKRLRRTISKLGSMYAKKHKGHNVSLKKSYAFGMIETIYKRLKVLYKDTPDTTALVVVKEQAIQDKLHELFGALRQYKTTPPKNAEAYLKGVHDGEKINLHRAVGSSKPRTIGEAQC